MGCNISKDPKIGVADSHSNVKGDETAGLTIEEQYNLINKKEEQYKQDDKPLAFETEFDEKVKNGEIDRPPPGRLHLQPILKLPENLEEEIMKLAEPFVQETGRKSAASNKSNKSDCSKNIIQSNSNDEIPGEDDVFTSKIEKEENNEQINISKTYENETNVDDNELKKALVIPTVGLNENESSKCETPKNETPRRNETPENESNNSETPRNESRGSKTVINEPEDTEAKNESFRSETPDSTKCKTPSNDSHTDEETTRDDLRRTMNQNIEILKVNFLKNETPESESSENKTPRGESNKSSRTHTPRNETPRSESIRSTTPKCDVKTPRTDSPRNETPKNDTSRSETPKNDTSRNETRDRSPSNKSSRSQTPRNDSPTSEIPKNDTSRSETPKNDTSRNETRDRSPSNKSSRSQTPRNETPENNSSKSPIMEPTSRSQTPKDEPPPRNESPVNSKIVESPRSITPRADTPKIGNESSVSNCSNHTHFCSSRKNSNDL